MAAGASQEKPIALQTSPVSQSRKGPRQRPPWAPRATQVGAAEPMAVQSERAGQSCSRSVLAGVQAWPYALWSTIRSATRSAGTAVVRTPAPA